MHRWRLSSSPSPLSPLSGLSHPLALPGIASGCCRDRLRLPAAGWLRPLCSGAGDDLRAGALSALCSVSAAGLACSALLSSSAAPVALPAELYGLRRSAAALLSATACRCCLWCSAGAALLLSHGARAGAARFVILHNFQGCISSIFLPFVRLATHKIIDFCPDFW